MLTAALDKLEKQLLKLKTKVIDGKRRSVSATRATEAPEPAPKPEGLRVYRAKPASRKPMTAEEAVLLIGKKPYLAFREAGTDALNVIIRRADGNLDLVEC